MTFLSVSYGRYRSFLGTWVYSTPQNDAYYRVTVSCSFMKLPFVVRLRYQSYATKACCEYADTPIWHSGASMWEESASARMNGNLIYLWDFHVSQCQHTIIKLPSEVSLQNPEINACTWVQLWAWIIWMIGHWWATNHQYEFFRGDTWSTYAWFSSQVCLATAWLQFIAFWYAWWSHMYDSKSSSGHSWHIQTKWKCAGKTVIISVKLYSTMQSV